MRLVSRVAAEEGRRPSPLPGCSEAAIKLYQRVGISRHDAGPGVSCVIARRQPAGCNALLGLGASPEVPTPRLLRGPGLAAATPVSAMPRSIFLSYAGRTVKAPFEGTSVADLQSCFTEQFPHSRSKPALGTSQTPSRRRSLSL